MRDGWRTIGCTLILFGASRWPRLYRWLRLHEGPNYEPEIVA
jgi:hypothetical protein